MKGGIGSSQKLALLLLVLVIACVALVWHSLQVDDAAQGLNSQAVSAQSNHDAPALQAAGLSMDGHREGLEAREEFGRPDPDTGLSAEEVSEESDSFSLQYMEITAPKFRTGSYLAKVVVDDWVDFAVEGDGTLGLGAFLDDVPAQFLLRREPGAALFAATREDLSLLEALPQAAPVELTFVPEFPPGFEEGHEVHIWALDDSAAVLGRGYYGEQSVILPEVPFSLEPVSRTESQPMKQRMLIGDLHEGIRYEVQIGWDDKDESVRGPRLVFDPVEFTPPASPSVAWRPAPGVHVRIAAEGIAGESAAMEDSVVGTAYFSGPRWERVEIRGGRGWVSTERFDDGEYEVWAEGADWVSVSPRTRITVLDNVPDVEEVWLTKEPRTATAQVRFNLPEDFFEGAKAIYTDASGKSRALPKRETPSTPARVRWEFPRMLVTDIVEPIDLAVFFPKAGAVACLVLAPGDDREVELTVAAPRLITKAQDVARALLEGRRNPNRGFLQMEACSSGEELRWLHIKSFNLAIPGYLNDREWTVPAPESARFRLRVYMEGSGWEIVPVPLD